MDFTYHANLDHKCKKDILIGRIKNVEDKSWKNTSKTDKNKL